MKIERIDVAYVFPHQPYIEQQLPLYQSPHIVPSKLAPQVPSVVIASVAEPAELELVEVEGIPRVGSPIAVLVELCAESKEPKVPFVSICVQFATQPSPQYASVLPL